MLSLATAAAESQWESNITTKKMEEKKQREVLIWNENNKMW